VALLLPAIQAAREAARRAQCKNNIKQIALGCLLHEGAQKVLPSGGWTYRYSGDPNRGYGSEQPGGWYYNILAYVEEQAVRDLGKGMTHNSLPFREATTKAHQTPIATFHCPSRRTAKLYPQTTFAGAELKWINDLPFVAKGDYAANSGDSLVHAGSGGTTGDHMWPISELTYADVEANASWTATGCKLTASAFGSSRPKMCQSGVIFYRSEIKSAQIQDGASNTYLVGEKFLSPLLYEENVADATNTLTNKGDNQGLYAGYEWDNHRVAWHPSSPRDQSQYQPRQDANLGINGGPDVYAFGSAHAGSMNISMCDGSVQSVSYDIDPKVHQYLASRLDGETAKLEP
jgi:prepilin-type processing-associated H-X9-DG protein